MGGKPTTQAEARAHIATLRNHIAAFQAQLADRTISKSLRDYDKAQIARLRGEIAAIRARIPSMPKK